MIPGIAFRTLQRDTAVDHQHLAGDIAGVIAEQKFHGVAYVPAGPFRLQHRGVAPFTALVGSLWVSRVISSICRPSIPPAALISCTANWSPEAW